MRLLGLDFETTGLDSNNDYITEVGAVLWDTETKTPLAMQSFLLDWELKTLDPVVTKLTGITLEALTEFGIKPASGLAIIHGMMKSVDLVAAVAHNGTAFDTLFYRAFCKRLGKEPLPLHWIDTQNDIPFPDDMKTRKLSYLAAEHAFLNPFAHRAVFDVLTMFKVLEAYDIEQVLALSHEPTIYLKAVVSFHEKDLARERGYRWNPDKKIWWRSFKESQAKKEIAECGFQTLSIPNPEPTLGN